MTTNYSACVLTSELSVSDVNLHPGQSFPPLDRKIRLAGGFSSVTPESNFPLSPTLQLNSDLSTLSHDLLGKLAEAEFLRANAASIKSYVVDPNMHVCVLANDADELTKFLDTYGGVLEITPLLLKGSHKDYEQVTELEIGKGDEGYKITSTVRSPINKEICTYCGECGKVCPQNCISPNLRVEYSDCTFCRECEPVCQVKAVDIYGVERQTILAPAIVVLSGVVLDLPDEQAGIFTSDSMGEYFATLFSTEIEEVVHCDNSICQYSPKLKGGCNLCLNACKAGAITQGADGVLVDYQICYECGSCTAVCPTGAMQNNRFKDSKFVDLFRAFPLPDSFPVVLGNCDDLHEFWWKNRGLDKRDVMFVEYPEPNGLSIFHFLYLATQCASTVFVVANENSSDSTQVVKANKIIDAIMGRPDFVKLVSGKDLGQALDSQDVKNASPLLKEKNINYSFINSRAKLADSLQLLSQNIDVAPTFTSQEFGPFATLSCDNEKCTQCFACLNECKVQALKAGADAMRLNHIQSLCIGCGVCTKVCPEDALKVTYEAVIAKEYFEEIEIAKDEPVTCKECGKEFGSKKGLEKVMSILSARKMEDKGHFEYCETCRVVKLFDTE